MVMYLSALLAWQPKAKRTSTRKLPSQRRASFCSASRESCSTASIVTSASSPSLLLLGYPQKPSCLKVSTHALSLKRAYGTDITVTTLSKPAVTWSTVEIHSHAVILGDHPAVSSGPPFTIEWTAFESVTLTLAEYEDKCNTHINCTKADAAADDDNSQRHRFSSSGSILIPNTAREAWLRKEGYSRKEMEITSQEIRRIKERRRSSARDRDGRGYGCLRM
jgi:hypothetical protein